MGRFRHLMLGLLLVVIGTLTIATSRGAGGGRPPARGGADWWSLGPLSSKAVPEVAGDGSLNGVDRFILGKLRERGLSPSPRADARALVRRVYFDLIGLPPPPEVIERFAADPSQGKWEALVNELLASPHYGERWARHWLDVARFGETDGYEYNAARDSAWPYRDWVIRALNDDMPYNRFAAMQIAGDVMEPGTLDGVAAVGFLVAGIHNTVLGKNPLMQQAARQDELEEIAGTVGQAMLGMTIQCARCHDHKYDPITSKEYYSFIAALDGVTHGERMVNRGDGAAQKLAALHAEREAKLRRLGEMIERRLGRAVTNENRLRLEDPIDANAAGTVYRVSFEVAPTVWADGAQATGETDGVVVSVIRKDGSALAEHKLRPGSWRGTKEPPAFVAQQFEYVGDDSGPVRLQIGVLPIHTGRFGGAVDNLRVTAGAERREVFAESFDTLHRPHPPGVQNQTGAAVHYGTALARWSHAGVNANHAVERKPGDYALQLFSGGSGFPPLPASTTQEVELQSMIDALTKQISIAEAEAKTTVFTVVPRAPGVMRVHQRGDVRTLGDAVAPGGIAAIGTVSSDFGLAGDAPDAQRRLKLAQWITHPGNPLFHRVIVNRVWHHHFGRGIVETPSDLGFNGGRPSHMELLDWLAMWFREHRYSLKALHRLIVTSDSYQQASGMEASAAWRRAAEIDAGNRLLWRQSARRMDAETLRDSILQIAGALNGQQFGPGYRDVRIDKVDVTHYYVAIDPVGEAFDRRTIYRWQARGERNALIESFDCPDPAITAPVRNVTTTPSQALSQWNSAFIDRMSKRLAERVRAEGGKTTRERIERMWRLVLGRGTEAGEAADAIALAEKHGLEVLARVVLNSNEMIWIE